MPRLVSPPVKLNAALALWPRAADAQRAPRVFGKRTGTAHLQHSDSTGEAP